VSRDIFVQDIPLGIRDAHDIPHDFRPRNGIVTRVAVIEALRAEAPETRLDDRGWAILTRPDVYHIEVNLGGGDLVDGFAFHISGGLEADRLIARVLRRLQLRAFDPSSHSGLFECRHDEDAI
jgi:hypothetical protein